MAELLTQRLRLRLLDAGDEALYRALYTSAAVMRYIAPALEAEAADRMHRRVVAHNAARTPGHRHWHIAWHDGTPAGLTALLRDGAAAEWGIVLLDASQGRRVADEVLPAIVAHAFASPGIERIVVNTQGGAHGERIGRLVRRHGFVDDPAATTQAPRWRLDRKMANPSARG